MLGANNPRVAEFFQRTADGVPVYIVTLSELRLGRQAFAQFERAFLDVAGQRTRNLAPQRLAFSPF